jgi:toxin ParE1/3/4
MKITFERAARDDLDRIFAWIAKDNPRAALEMIARIEAKVMRLTTPGLVRMGRPGLVEGTRELLEWPYIIVYEIREEDDEIVIVSVMHGARDREGRQIDLLQPASSSLNARFTAVSSGVCGTGPIVVLSLSPETRCGTCQR